MYAKGIKRGLDFVLALIALIGLWPLFLIIAVWIKLDSKGPIFFQQKRCGKGFRFFSIYKFRTMKVDTPKNIPTHLLDHPDKFITKPGKFLRKTSLDELPQVFNILKGEMAIIGPRPALWNQDDLMELRRMNGSSEIRPGLTGWAQIHGRDELPIKVKAELDGYYARNLSFSLDVRCFFGTIFSVLSQKGIKEGKTDSITVNRIEVE